MACPTWDVRGPNGKTYQHIRIDKGPGDKQVIWSPKPSADGVKLRDLSLYAADRLPASSAPTPTR